jgi:signal transduction histidine kinase
MFKGSIKTIPQEYSEELEREVLFVNIKRETILSVILLFLVVIILFLTVFVEHTHQLTQYISTSSIYIHILLIIISLVFLTSSCCIKKIDRNIKHLKSFHRLLNLCVLVLCALIAINNELADKQPFTYVIAMFAIASTVLLSKWERIVIYIIPYTIYIIGLHYVQNLSLHRIYDGIFLSILVLLALIISGLNYNSQISNFIKSKIILSKNRELDNLYKASEENLKKRTDELNEVIELEKLRTVFFSNISHELRTPLNVIYSAEQMLDFEFKKVNETKRNAKIGDYLKIIKQNCYRLIRLIANLIDITKMDSGYFQVNPSNNDIVKIVEDITLSVAKYIEHRKINLIFDTEVEEKIIACDPDKIERIILNLLSNAVKFTPVNGTIGVNIYDKGSSIIISVKDSGIGIPSGMRESIFERFVQVDRTTTRTREGSGIGLSIVKSLVELHNGAIRLVSDEGKGSEFIIEIPVAIMDNDKEDDGFNMVNENHNIEKINIEFSDIYN